MKTTRIIISITLIALATTSFAQMNGPKDKNFHNKTDVHSLEVITEKDPEVENWMTVPFTTDLTRDELCVEAWMTVPFKSEMEIEFLSLESWMATPFETGQSTEKEWVIAEKRN